MKREKKLENPDRISSYFRMETVPLALVTVSGILYNLGMTAGPYFEGQLVQRLYDVIHKTAGAADMAALAGRYLLTILLVQAMRCVKRFYVRRFANDTARSMRRVLYHSLVHRSRAELEGESAGTMMTRAVSDVDACAEGMRKVTTEVFDTGVALAAYLAMLLAYDWRLTLLSCAFTPAAYLIAARLKKTVTRCGAAYKKSAGQLSDATLDRVYNAQTYRIFGRETNRDTAYEKRLEDYEKRAVSANLWENTMQPVYQLISMLGAIPILYFGAKNVLGTGWTAWDIASFTTFLACFSKLAVKSSKAAKLFNSVQKAQVSWARVKPMLKACGEPDTATDLDFRIPRGLTAEHLSFGYPGGAELARDVSFTAAPGEIIGITGPVASGKSALGKLFLGEVPYAGSLRIGDRELSSLSEYERSRLVSYLGHEPELMSDTIAENIRMGSSRPAAPYLKAVCLDGEVAQMPAGEDTPVGSGGVRLSGGQQARTALARALYHGRNILVLDDPFSAVDRATEREIFDHLRALSRDRVVLLISHRLNVFPECSQVLWLAGGRAQIAPHEELMKTNAAYAALYRTRPTGGDLDEAK